MPDIDNVGIVVGIGMLRGLSTRVYSLVFSAFRILPGSFDCEDAAFVWLFPF